MILPARANPTAVPKNGAEQGVANIVANAPVMKFLLKLLELWIPSPEPFAKLLIELGKRSSNKPHRLYAKKATIILNATINHGC